MITQILKMLFSKNSSPKLRRSPGKMKENEPTKLNKIAEPPRAVTLDPLAMVMGLELSGLADQVGIIGSDQEAAALIGAAESAAEYSDLDEVAILDDDFEDYGTG
jgi:hypothetical protein